MSEQQPPLYDAAGRWRRWELESFDGPETAPVEEAGQPDAGGDTGPNLPDPAEVLAEIERLREAATARGHAEGFAAGHAQGMEAGLTEGRERGFAEGREAGLAEGRAEGLAAVQEEAEKIQRLAQACAQSIANIEEETGEALVNLAVSIARQVLRSTLKAEPERILDVVQEILQADGSHQGILKLRVNPADLELVDQYLQNDGTVSHWRLQADMSIDRGGCIAETSLGNIDATLQTRWKRVTSTLGVKS